jgi:putative ABC transport system substrate-binding protein
MDRRAFLGTLAGGLLAAPLAGEAEQVRKVWKIGCLYPSPASFAAPLVTAFEKALAERGYTKGTTLTIDYVFSTPSRDQLKQAAAALSERVDVLVTWGTVTAAAAKEARVSCPVVFVSVGFPLQLGLIQSLRELDGNFTGITYEGVDDTYGKRLQILKDIVPGLTRVAALAADDDPNIIPALDTAHRVAPSLGIEIHDVRVRTVADLPSAFAHMIKKRIQGVLVIAGAFVWLYGDRIAALALKHRLPSVHGLREAVAAGGLVSLGPDLIVNAGEAAGYVDKILRGTKPADLPVEQPARYEIHVNLKTAKALGLTIPPSLLLRADQVIDP